MMLSILEKRVIYLLHDHHHHRRHRHHRQGAAQHRPAAGVIISEIGMCIALFLLQRAAPAYPCLVFANRFMGWGGEVGKEKELADMRYSLPICSISCNLIDFLITLSLPGQVHFFLLSIQGANRKRRCSVEDESDLLRSSQRMGKIFQITPIDSSISAENLLYP